MEEERQRIEAHWKEHPEEKKALEDEKNNLRLDLEALDKEEKEIEESIKQLETVIGELRRKDEQLNSQIQDLTTKHKQLGAFKLKEKRQLQDQIASLQQERPSRSEIEEEEKTIRQERAAQVESLKAKQKDIRDIKNEKHSGILKIEKALELKEDTTSLNVDDVGWIICDEPGFVRCPKCNKRYAIDFIKYRDKCTECGCERKR